MAAPRRLYSEEFKRRAVERMAAAPDEISSLARELGISRSRLYEWRKKYAPPPVSPSAGTERGSGGEVSVGPGGEVVVSGPGVTAASISPLVSPLPACVGEGSGGEGLTDDAGQNQRLRQSLLDTAFALTHAIRDTTESAPLNQLSAALGLIIDRLLKLEALALSQSVSVNPEVFHIAYTYPDGTQHSTPPWAEGDPAFAEPVLRGRLRSPFWKDRSGEDDDSGDSGEGG
ncbi:MAG: transposase [Anaerolineae bacterium]|nr:transposase [Anaerolineae bacterium]